MRDDDEEDEDKKWYQSDMLRAALIGQINAWFLLSDIIDTLWDYAAEKPWAMRQKEPSIGVLNNIAAVMYEPAKKTIDYLKQDEDEDAVEFGEVFFGYILGLLNLVGVPVDKGSRMGAYLERILTGEETDPIRIIYMLLNYNEWTVYGEKEMKRRKKEEKDAKKVTPSTAPAIGEEQTTGFGAGKTGFGKGKSGFKKQETGFNEN